MDVVSIHSPSALSMAREVIHRGGVVCTPTETVYGLVCSTRPASVERLMRIKGRPSNKPFALFASSWRRMLEENIETCLAADILAGAFWPGPVTLVVGASASCPGAYAGSIGVRCPGHLFVQELLRECGGLLVNTSFNRSGEPECRALDLASDLLEEVDLAVDGGVLPLRLPSTVVDCRTDPPQILRHGEIAEEKIRRALMRR
ncbi:MAG: L-threonylcarbamoyladenylate synthase [Candidatus Hinthialibacter sp.]